MNDYSSLPRPEKNIFIYVLLDPDTNEPKYVGLTTYGFSRITLHYTSCYQTSKTGKRSAVKKWIQSLREQNKIFKINYIQYFDKDTIELDEAEDFWINYYKSLGYKLYNHETGGRWDGPLTSEMKKLKSDRTKHQMSNPEARERVRQSALGNKNSYGKLCKILQDQTGKIYNGLTELAKSLGCSEGRIRNHFNPDGFEIDNLKIKVLINRTIPKNVIENQKESIRKTSYIIEDHSGNRYCTVKEAAEKMGISTRALSHYVQGSSKTVQGEKYKVYRNGILIKDNV